MEGGREVGREGWREGRKGGTGGMEGEGPNFRRRSDSFVWWNVYHNSIVSYFNERESFTFTSDGFGAVLFQNTGARLICEILCRCHGFSW